MSFYANYPATAGVLTLNGQAGALTLVAGSNITLTPGAGSITIAASGGGGGGATTALDNLAAVAINVDLAFATGAVANIISETGRSITMKGFSGTESANLASGGANFQVLDGHIVAITNAAANGLFDINGQTTSLFGDGSTFTQELQFWDKAENNSFGLKAPDTLSASTTLTWPNGIGTAGSSLTNDGAGNLYWGNGYTKYTRSYTDFSDPSSSKEITLVNIPAGVVFEAEIIHHTASFAGGTTVSASMDFNINGSTVTTVDVNAAPVNGADSWATFGVFPIAVDFVTPITVSLNLTIVGDTLDNLTSGSIDIYIKTIKLP
jgi:hypothetical protein